MPNDDKSLLAQVRRLQKAVTRKVSRIHTHHGVDMSGSSADPRIPAASRNSLNEHQLREYSHSLADFLRRDVQFVPDAQSRPMPRAEWETYKRLESKWNVKVRAYMSDIQNLVLPTGMTVRQAEASYRPDRPELTNPSVNGPRPIERESRNVGGRAALRRFIDQMQDRNSPEYFESLIEANKETAEKLLTVVGNDRLTALVNSLTPEQFDVLWNWTPFVMAAAYMYEFAQREISAKDKASWRGTLQNDMEREALKNAEWAQTLEI